ncbi:hypothetical protein ABEB36_002224 [Hypothenemus hampei]|uniref:SIFamide n=1 Tax=Hypothenemus hampei TaxID=57062 RepID=A0ABD1F4Z7_HYPHA
MSFSTKVAILFVAIAFLLVITPAVAAYRKPPFNGSIFGKRAGGLSAEYDSAGKTLSAMCEIANEACQSWFPSQEK